MKQKGKTTADFEKKFQKVLKTPASFDLYVAIHDFIEHIESEPSFLKTVSSESVGNLELKIPTKYSYLKQIYQGLEDAENRADGDLGHARYAVVVELNKIRDNDVSDSNSFWKKREVVKRFVTEIYGRLVPQSV